MQIRFTKEGPDNVTMAICSHTQIRAAACVCGACVRFTTTDTKYKAVKRDVLELLKLLAGCIDCHPSHECQEVTWSDVDRTAHLRERLMEMAIGFAVMPDRAETAARRRVEEALCAPVERVEDALIEAL